jgi:hypothetical protein
VRFGAPRVPTDFGLDFDPVDPDHVFSERFEDPSPSSRDPRSSRAPLNFERAERVRRWGLGIAIAFGSFAFVLAVLLLFAAPARQQRVSRAPSRVELPASTAPSLGKGEIVPAPPRFDHLPAPPSESPPPVEPEASPVAPSPPEAAPSAGFEGPTPLAKADAPQPLPAATSPSRPGLFSQVPVRPGTN